MALMAMILGLGLLFYILLGLRYSYGFQTGFARVQKGLRSPQKDCHISWLKLNSVSVAVLIKFNRRSVAELSSGV